MHHLQDFLLRSSVGSSLRVRCWLGAKLFLSSPVGLGDGDRVLREDVHRPPGLGAHGPGARGLAHSQLFKRPDGQGLVAADQRLQGGLGWGERERRSVTWKNFGVSTRRDF